MRAPDFWTHDHMDWRAVLLLPASLVYSVVAARRLRRPPEWTAPIPVFCVGNPTVGGAGKTPMAALVARQLARMGRQPVFLSRGYGGSARRPTTVDLQRHRAADVGDEPLILAHQATTVVSPDRVAGAMRAAKLGDAVVMDDGFQNPALAKNLSLLVVDTVAGLGNGLPLPAGPLRAPVGDQLARSQALVLVGDGDRADFIARAAELFGLPILRASLAPEADVAARLLGQKIVAFAGIGRPDKFFATLETMGARLAETRGFPDHHPYSDTEALELLDIARREGAVLATTEKDMMRLEGTGSDALTRLAAESVMVPVRAVLEPDSAATLDTLIQNVLSRYP